MDWPELGGSSGHQGVNASESAISSANVASLHQHWQIQLPATANGAPVVAVDVPTMPCPQDLVLVTTLTGSLIARNLETGAAVWSIDFPAGSCPDPNGIPCYTYSSPVIVGGFAYTYGLDGKVHKVVLGTGTEVTGGGWPEVATIKPDDEKGSSALSFAQAADGHTYLYATNAGFDYDTGDYQGHVTAIDLATGAQNVFNTLCSNLTTHLAPGACSELQSGVWARSGVTYSPATNRIYLATGNGAFDPTSFDWGDSVIALNPDGTGAGGGGSPVDSYTPTNYQFLADNDEDLGSTLPALVDAPMGSTVAHLGVQGGKDGTLKLLNLDDLSGQGGPGNIGGELQTIAEPGGPLHVEGALAVWVDGTGRPWVFVGTRPSGNPGMLVAYDVTLNGSHQPQLTQRWVASDAATSPVIANGVLYAAGNGSIRAYDPVTGALLWSAPTGSIHWQSPVVVDGLLLLEDEAGDLTAWGP